MSTAPLNILVVSQFYDSHRGGLEIVAGHLAREWTERGMNVRWAAADLTPPPPALAATGRAPGLKVWNWTENKLGIPFPLPRPSAILKLWREIRTADAVVAHDSLYATTVASWAFARMTGKSFYVIQHIGHIAYKNPILRGLMAIANTCVARPVLARADQVVFISHNTADYFRTVKFSAPPQLIFNGVDTATFMPCDATARSAARAKFALTEAQPVALFVGRFVEKKGLLTLCAMAERMPEVTFLLAGWGPIDPKTWALPNVRVIEGLSGEQLVPLYHLSDALVLPSFGEGLPLVVQEALACGLRVLCGSDSIDGDPQLASVATGLRVDPTNTNGTAKIFAAALRAACTEPDNQKAERAAFARARYNWSASANRYLHVFDHHRGHRTSDAAAAQIAPV